MALLSDICQIAGITLKIFKSNLSFYLLYYAEACYEYAEFISALLYPNYTAPFEEMRWRAVGLTVSNLTGLKFKPQISYSKDELVTVRLTMRS